MGMRFLFLLIDLGAGGFLFLLLRLKRMDPDWLFLYAWNPLVLKEITNSVHLDIAVAVSLLGLIFALDQFEKTGRFRFLLLSSLFMAGSVLLKIYPVILIPACCFIFIRKQHFRELLLFLFLIFLLIGLCYLPYIGIGLDRITEGLTTFSQYWRMNDGIYGLISWMTLYARMITAGLIGAISILVPCLRKTSCFSDITGDLWWVLLFWFLLIPTPFPWYAVPLCALVVILPDQDLHRILLILTGALALYYLSFVYEYGSFAGYWWTLTRVIEHSLIWSVILYTLIRKLILPRRRNQSESLGSAS
jgi:hypothetical protein